MRIYSFFILIILLFSCISPVLAGQFKPWDSHEKAGDECLELIDVEIKKSHPSSCANNILQYRPSGVFNGVQGGAFFLIRFFQVVISPQDGPNCRFVPVCSSYGRQAVEKYGALLGAMLAGERLLRCNPYSRPGHDPVPEKVFED